MTGRDRISIIGRGAVTHTTYGTMYGDAYACAGVTYIVRWGGDVQIADGPLTGWVFPSLGAALAACGACAAARGYTQPARPVSTRAGSDPW